MIAMRVRGVLGINIGVPLHINRFSIRSSRYFPTLPPHVRVKLSGEYDTVGSLYKQNLCRVATQVRCFSSARTLSNSLDNKGGVEQKKSNSVRLHLVSAKNRIEESREETKKKDTKVRSFGNLKIILRILQLGRRDLKLFIYAIGLILVAVLYPSVLVKLVGAAIDSLNNEVKDSEGNLLIWGYTYNTVFGVMVPFMFVSAVCFWARNWVLKLLGERLVARFRLRVMKHLLRNDARFYDREDNKVGDLISRLSSDAYVVSRSITGNLPDGLKNILFGIISSYMMYVINPFLFGVMLLISPPITFGSVIYGEKIRSLSTKLQAATASLTKDTEEILSSVKLIQAFTGEQKEVSRYSRELRSVVNAAKNEAFAQSNYSVSIYSLYHAGYLACVALGIKLILNGLMSTGDVVAFTMYLELFNMALYSCTTTYMELMKGAGAAVKLFNLTDYKNDVEPVLGSKLPSQLGNSVEFRNVDFSYPSRPNQKIFKNCSFFLPASSSTCFVSPSGCGKSTIAALLLRYYNINSGKVLIGGHDINDFEVRDLRRKHLGVVQQEPILMSGTILENLVYGLTPQEINKMTMDDVIDITKQANCHDFISSFPNGYDTIIGSQGASLSGGQKQRVAIARALFKKPAILILDEATSALDSKLESMINETLKELRSTGQMTIISIAHRLSTISKSEYVAVLNKNGNISEHGKFIELYSNPHSELSKLLDESDFEPSEDSDEKYHEKDASEESKVEKSIDLLENAIEQLPQERRAQIVSQLSKRFAPDSEYVSDHQSPLNS